MSLILEALRKSEAERRRGLAPDLFTELPPAVRQRDAGLSPAVWVGLAVAVLIGAAWLTREQWSAPGRDDRTSTPVREDALDATSPPPQQASTQPAMTAPTGRDNAAGVAAIPVPSSDANIGAPPFAPSSSSASALAASENAAVAQQRADSASAPTPARDPPSPLPREIAAAPVTPPAPAVVLPAPAASAPAASAPTASASGTLDLNDLSGAQRKQLPPLRMSMHMWDADPARRFVIIDGARRGEGDRLGEAVVERIDADSVLLNWNGQRLRMPLR